MLTIRIKLHLFFFPDDVNISPVKEADSSKLSKNDVISNIMPLTSTQASNNDRDSIMQLANENPLGIKIKEITKPEEIRITDDKPKPFNPFKSTTTSTTSTTTIASTTASLEVTTETESKAATESSTIALTTESLKESKELSTEDTNQSPNLGEQEVLDNGVSIDNNSSDAPSPPPPVKAFVEPETLLSSGADSNSISDDASNKNVRQIVEHSTSGSDIDQFSEVNDFSSTTELSTDSVVQYDASTTERGEEGDLTSSSTPQNVFFFRQGGKTEPFHISGTDGLIRVEELEIDVSSTTENENSNFNQESTPRDIETSSGDGMPSGSSEFPSMESSTPTTSEPETLDETGTISLEKQLDSALSSNATGIDNLSNNSIEVSTLDDGLESSSEFASSERVYQTIYYRSDEKLSTASPLDETPFETNYYPPSSTEDSSESSSTIDPESSSSTTSSGEYSTTDQSTTFASTESLSTAKPTDSFDEEQDATPDTNPYYPVDIPVDVSIHQKVNEQDDKRRLPSKVLDDAISSSTQGPTCDDCDDIDKIEKESSSTQGPSDQEVKKSHENDVIESRVPGEPSLIPEWERNTTEKMSVTEASTTVGPPNDTEINALNKTVASNENNVESVNKSAALMLETTVAPVDSEEMYGRKEPTTARTTTKSYANVNDSDDTSSPSSEQQLENSTTDGALPDDDAESIKLTSSASDDDDTNESYEQRPLKLNVPDSIQNYWRYVSKVNGWTV